MAETILHPATEEHVAQFSRQPVHAVLLVGSNGIGKRYVANLMVANILDLALDKLKSYPYLKSIAPEKSSISIELIRELQRFLQLKTLGSDSFRRAVIIEHAEALTTEAQNAFLKILEEPPADTLIILTAANQRALLPTIMSRVQTVSITAPAETELKTFFAEQGKSAQAITQAYFLSGGLPGLMTALLDEDSEHPLTAGVTGAKEILQKQLFERLALVEGLSKQREQAVSTLEALQHIAQTGLNQAAAKADAAKIKQWHRILKVTTEALDNLAQNVNAKLVLDYLMLGL